MNIFLNYKKKFLKYLLSLKKKKIIDFPVDIKNLTVEISPKEQSSDMSCNVAMLLSKYNNKAPIDLADKLKEHFKEDFNEFQDVKSARPGFLNFSFKSEFWKKYIIEILKQDSKFGIDNSSKVNYNLEFVSANPTGPMHVGHCRGAILGDVIANLLKFNGNKVHKEYYVNDYGGQIRNFVQSVYYRILEIKEDKKFPDDKDLYPGNYIIDIAEKILKEKKIKNFSNFDKIYNSLSEESLNSSIKLIKKNLKDLGIRHDIFVKESQLIKKKLVTKVIDKLKKNNHVYTGKLEAPKGESDKNWKSRDLLLFRSTKFGDDADRVIQKEDKSWTYFASDIAYHSYKIDRKFDVLINILGADHAGYIKRIKAAVKAISNNKVELICKVSQLVKLFKEGKPFKMSKRKGDYITAEDLLNEVGKDSVRFIMLNRSNDVELDFDFQKVTEKSKENPVFYVQYAYARINSIFRLIKLDIDKYKINKDFDFDLNNHELEILRKISEWPKCIEMSYKKLEPHRIPYYLYDLSTLFHSYWNMGKENKSYRFIQDGKIKNNSRLTLLKAISIVIQNGMSILGVSTPKSM